MLLLFTFGKLFRFLTLNKLLQNWCFNYRPLLCCDSETTSSLALYVLFHDYYLWKPFYTKIRLIAIFVITIVLKSPRNKNFQVGRPIVFWFLGKFSARNSQICPRVRKIQPYYIIWGSQNMFPQFQNLTRFIQKSVFKTCWLRKSRHDVRSMK